MLPIRKISYLLPMCCSFWEKCKNSKKTGLGCSTPLIRLVTECSNLFIDLIDNEALSFKNAYCAPNITSQDIQVWCSCKFYISNCIILPDLDVMKIALLKAILGVWWCAIALACFKRQGLDNVDFVFAELIVLS